MPIRIIKSSYEYCAENKLFFAFVLVVLFACQYVTDLLDSQLIGPIIISILTTGYGLQVTQDIINGGTRLPKIMPKKVISFGLKGMFIFYFYLFIQIFFLAIVSVKLNFPTFEMEELILNYSDTINLFIAHDPISFTIFIISGIIIVYVTTFFMELSLARLADGGKLRKSFNFPRIKRAIDIIGWKSYSWDYTKIIFSVVFLTFLLHYEIQIQIIDSIVDAILNFLIFSIQFIGIGKVYKVYTDNKPD